MEDKVKDIISSFIRIPAEQISSDTVIDRSAVSSSITLHRMYAKLAEEGFVIADYTTIKTFSTLLKRVNGNGQAALSQIQEVQLNGGYLPINEQAGEHAVGIDIEEVDAMPQVSDFRENEFYKMNFCPAEIAYCILQPQPYASFAGLFAAKEAIVKANNSNRNKPFNTIVIDHDAEGKPVYPGFQLSVSHTKSTAVAVALQIRVGHASNDSKNHETSPATTRPNRFGWLLAISILISIAAFLFAIIK